MEEGVNVVLRGKIYVVKDPQRADRGAAALPQMNTMTEAKVFWEDQRLKTWLKIGKRRRGMFLSKYTLGYYGGLENLDITTQNERLNEVCNSSETTIGDENSIVKHDAALNNFSILCFRILELNLTEYLDDYPPKTTTYTVKQKQRDPSFHILQHYIQF